MDMDADSYRAKPARWASNLFGEALVNHTEADTFPEQRQALLEFI
jgi:hypothetical protein